MEQNSGTGTRSGVLSLSISSRSAIHAAYMPFIKNGGFFIPMSRQYALGDEVFVLLQLMDDPTKLAVQGKVVWITPADAHGSKQQGIGIQFPADEGGSAVKIKIEQILGGSIASKRPTHTL